MKNANIRLVLLAGMASAASAVHGQTLDETRGYAAELLADAEQRTSLLGAPTSAWTGNNFQIGNADGTFVLNVSAYNQTRGNINISDDDATTDGFESGFSQPRTRLIFDGNVVNPDTFYRIEVAFDGTDTAGFGGFFGTGNAGIGTLLDAYVGHRFSSGLTVTVGQRKIDLLRSFNQGSNRNQLIEGTTVESAFNPGRSQGVFFMYEGEQGNWRYSGAFTDGAGTLNTDFTANPPEADWAISNRFDFAIDGDLDAFADSIRQFPGGDGATIVGGNIHIQESANAPATVRTLFIQYGGDIIFQSPDGWNIFAEFVGRYTDTDGLPTFNDFGVAVQGGFFIDEQTEIAGAWDILLPDDERAGNVDPFNTLQGNVNYWPFAGSRAVKLSAGAIVFVNNPTETGGFAGANTRLGLLTSDSDGQVAITGQVQIQL
ncbi:MAG: porin [Planctomycetota bacterium]